MELKTIDPNDLNCSPCSLWLSRWLVLSAGTPEDCNAMTVAWGAIGGMWRRPFAQIVVRPSRHTLTYLERLQEFTLCVLPEEHRNAYKVLGSRSGRDGDKITPSGLTLLASEKINAPGFAEAELILECRTLYWQDMDPEHFLNDEIEPLYKGSDYHRIYYGEIVNARGTDIWRR